MKTTHLIPNAGRGSLYLCSWQSRESKTLVAGLGDIVLPGLLISFAARLVEATYLVWHGHANTFVSSGDAATAAESSEEAKQQSAQYPQMRDRRL